MGIFKTTMKIIGGAAAIGGTVYAVRRTYHKLKDDGILVNMPIQAAAKANTHLDDVCVERVAVPGHNGAPDYHVVRVSALTPSAETEFDDRVDILAVTIDPARFGDELQVTQYRPEGPAKTMTVAHTRQGAKHLAEHVRTYGIAESDIRWGEETL